MMMRKEIAVERARAARAYFRKCKEQENSKAANMTELLKKKQAYENARRAAVTAGRTTIAKTTMLLRSPSPEVLTINTITAPPADTTTIIQTVANGIVESKEILQENTSTLTNLSNLNHKNTRHSRIATLIDKASELNVESKEENTELKLKLKLDASTQTNLSSFDHVSQDARGIANVKASGSVKRKQKENLSMDQVKARLLELKEILRRDYHKYHHMWYSTERQFDTYSTPSINATTATTVTTAVTTTISPIVTAIESPAERRCTIAKLSDTAAVLLQAAR